MQPQPQLSETQNSLTFLSLLSASLLLNLSPLSLIYLSLCWWWVFDLVVCILISFSGHSSHAVFVRFAFLFCICCCFN